MHTDALVNELITLMHISNFSLLIAVAHSRVRIQNLQVNFFFLLQESPVTLVHFMPPPSSWTSLSIQHTHKLLRRCCSQGSSPIQYKGFIWSIYCKSELQEWNYMITNVRRFAIRHTISVLGMEGGGCLMVCGSSHHL